MRILVYEKELPEYVLLQHRPQYEKSAIPKSLISEKEESLIN